MSLSNTPAHYGYLSKYLHWLMAFAIIALIAVGLYMTALPPSDTKWSLYGLHKATGIVLLALVLLRLSWHRFSPTPPLLLSLPRWQKICARFSHGLLYTAMLALPLSGWLMSSAGGYPVSLFGWFDLPALIDKDPDIARIARAVHDYIGLTLIVLIAVHAGAALYHHFIQKDQTLRRLLP